MIKYFSRIIDKVNQVFENEKDFNDESVVFFQKLADFYFEKHSENTNSLQESNRNAADEIRALGISKLFFYKKNNCLHVHLCRPGILIGKKGENIAKLQNFLGVQIKLIETKSVGDIIINQLAYLDWDD